MPFSNLEQATPILKEIKAMRPRSILDVGCGLGVYGYLCRIYLELYGDDEGFMKKLRHEKPWEIRIDAIEGFPEYLKYIPGWAYDEIKIGSAMDILSGIPRNRYDLVLALAILEHFPKDEGIHFLDELRRIGRKIIASVPKEWNEQIVPENELETHRSHWTDADLLSWGFNRFLPHPFVWIAILDDGGEGERENEEPSLFYNQPKFHNNAYRFFFRLSPISSNEMKCADVAGETDARSLRSFYARYETSTYEKWALRCRIGTEIRAIAILEDKEATLFVHDIVSQRTCLKQLLQKLDNLAVRRGLQRVAIVPGTHGHELEALGYIPVTYSMLQTHGM